MLVLAVSLTVCPGVSAAAVRGATGFSPVVRQGIAAVITGDTPAAQAAGQAPVLLDLATPDRGGRVNSGRIDSLPDTTVDEAITSRCPGAVATNPMATSRAHRDDVSATPTDERADGCRLAGPKRFHGAAGRTDVTAVAPAVLPATVATGAAARWSGSYNLYRKTAFVTQKDFTWCVAASVQMMVNLVRHRSDRTEATQQRMIRYAQASDHGPWGPGGGTDVTGWIAALRHFGAGKYRAVGTSTPAAALRIAATAMRQTGRPAGMLVMEGRHAWILHGFESQRDPTRSRYATITSVRVSGPLYPIQQKHGYDLRPNTELSVGALATFFQPSSVGALVGKYVVIVPVH